MDKTVVKLANIKGSQLINYLNFRKDPLKWLYEQLFLGDIVAINPSFPKPSYVVHAPDVVKEILTTKDANFIKGNSSKIFSRTLGSGLLTSEGEEHKRQRKMIQPAFHKKRIASYSDVVCRYTRDLISLWEDGEEREISQDMMNVTLRIVMKTLFGEDVKRQEARVTKAVNDIIEKSAQLLLWPIPFLDKLPTISNRNYKNGVETLNRLSDDLIKLGNNSKSEDHLLSLLLDTKYEDGSNLSHTEIRDQIVTFVIAGHETTANVLSWIWYLLSTHPEVEKKLHMEIDNILKGEVPSFEHLPKLHYATQIFQEALRLYPAAWIILREAKKDVEITGHYFKKGTSFLISPYAIQRHPKYYEQADEFMPERFEKENQHLFQNYTYIPFGAGSRGCIGSQFAMMEAVLVVVTIAQKYKLKLEKPSKTIKPEPLLSLRIKGGIKMRIIQRERSGNIR